MTENIIDEFLNKCEASASLFICNFAKAAIIFQLLIARKAVSLPLRCDVSNCSNMKKLFIPLIVLGCLLFTGCDEDEVVSESMEWTLEILTPESVKLEGVSLRSMISIPGYSFRATGEEGDIVMTCENYDVLHLASGNSDTYDCGWATVKVEANKVKIHFPYNTSGAPEASETITISAKNGKQKARTIIDLVRTFENGEQPGPEPQPEESKFKMTMAGFTPFMQLDSPLPAPLDLVTFRITDINDNFTPQGFPEFTQHYDSIVWSAEGYPHTFKVYERRATDKETEEHLNTQWASHFFKSGTIKNHLRGYRNGKVEYETSLDVTLYERDFLGIEWGTIVLQKPQNLTTYCRLDTDYEYQVNDITAKGGNPFSEIIPVNHRLLSDPDFLTEAQKAIKTLMENNVGEGQSAEGKELLFKCLPEKGVEAEMYWENKTTRMLMLHQLPDDPDGLVQEKYYLHIEPKQ